MTSLTHINEAVQKASIQLNIPTPTVTYARESDILNPAETAYFNPSSYGIYFNPSWVKNANPLEVLLSAYMQVRYAYQFYAIEYHTNEPAEVLAIWQKEKHHNLEPKTVFEDEIDLEYIKQAYVLDAIAYGHLMLLERHDTVSMIPEEIKKQVLELVNQMKQNAKIKSA